VSFLVDTNVLCEAIRPRPDARVLDWLDKHDALLHVSALSLAEITKGIQLLPAGKKRRALQAWYEELLEAFAERILPFDATTARVWGEMTARHQHAGRILASFDSLIAATAAAHNLVLATRNTADFPADIPTVNPWEK
jgi:hypothetical protein